MTDSTVNSAELKKLREQLHDLMQQACHLASPGGLLVGWAVCMSVASADNPLKGGILVEAMSGQGAHTDLGLFEMGAAMTRRRAGIYHD